MPMWMISLILLTFFKLSLGQESLSLPATSPEIGSFAAIAYSESTGRHGFGVNYPTAALAAERARFECRKRASDCQVIAEFSKQCAALVVEQQGAGFKKHLAFAASESAAELLAFAECSSEPCSLRRLLCTAGDY